MESLFDGQLVRALSVLPRFYLVARKSMGRAESTSGYELAAVAAAEWLGSMSRSLDSFEWQTILGVAHMMGPALEDLQSMVDYSDMPIDEVERGLLLQLRDEFDSYLIRVGWYLPSADVVKRTLDGALCLHETQRNSQVSAAPSRVPAMPMMM